MINLTFLLARSDEGFSFDLPTAWIVGKAQIPKSSDLRDRFIMSLSLLPSTFENCRVKSSGSKCLEHNTENFDGCHFARFSLTKSTHFFLLLVASARSSPWNGIICIDMPSLIFLTLPQPAATHLVGISFDFLKDFPLDSQVNKGEMRKYDEFLFLRHRNC